MKNSTLVLIILFFFLTGCSTPEISSPAASAITNIEQDDYEYLLGKNLNTANNIQNRAAAIEHFHKSWSNYNNVKGALEEGNLLMAEGNIAKNWESIRDAYQYFIFYATLDQKSQHPEVEKNLELVEPYNQAEIAKREITSKKQAKIDELNARREEREQEKIRLAEKKRIARDGDGSEDDMTCKGYGAKPGTKTYINCRIQLGQSKKTADQQQAAQTRASNERRAEQADYEVRLEAARHKEQARRDAENQRRREGAALSAIGTAIYNNSTPQQAPAPSAPIQCMTVGNIIRCQ